MSAFWTCDDCRELVNCHDDNHDCPGPRMTECDVEDAVERIVNARLRAIAERLRVPHGGLVPDAEVYVRTVLAQAIEEELEER